MRSRTRTRSQATATRVEAWVATMTFSPEDRFYEEGGVYSHEPKCSHTQGARPLDPSERLALCPRCGQEFAATADNTAEANRDLHFDGDEDIPSICRHLPARQLQLVQREPR